MPMYGTVRYGTALYGRDAGPNGGGGADIYIGDQVQSPPLSTGGNPSSIPASAYGPNAYVTRSASHWRRLLDQNGVPILEGNGQQYDGRIIVGGEIVEVVDEVPRAYGRIQIANPEGLYTNLFTEGQVILVRDDVTYNNGITYAAYLGGGRMGITEIAQVGGIDGDQLYLSVMNAGQLLLDGEYQGDLGTDAVVVAGPLGLMGPDGQTASVQGIMAFLLTLGGASAIGLEGSIIPIQSWTAKFGLDRISPFIIPAKKPLNWIISLCMEVSKCSYWIDWDGTAIIKASPRDVLDIGQQTPIRRYAESGQDVFFETIAPSPKQSILRVEVFNQNASGAPRSVRYFIPPGGGIPIQDLSTASYVAGAYKRFDIAAIPTSPVDDATGALDDLARRLAYQESLKANNLPITTPPDPFVRAGDQAMLAAPRYNAVGAFRYKQVVHPLGPGRFRAVLQRLFFPTDPDTDPTNTWATKVPRFQFAAPYVFQPTLGAIIAPYRPDLYHYTPYTFEGFMKLVSWPKSAGAWVPLSLFSTTDTAVELTTANGTNFTVTVNAWSESAIGPGPSGKTVVGTFNFAWANDGAWHHWALSRALNWLGLWIDGVLVGSITIGIPALTPVLTSDGSSSRYYAARIMSYDGTSFLPVDAANQGEFAVYSWRFSRSEKYNRANFTPLVTGFGANTPADYPAILSVWSFLGLNAATAQSSGVYYAQSSVSALSASIAVRQSTWLPGIDPPFI